MNRSDYSTRSDACDKALAAVSELRGSDPLVVHELMGRLCWLAPDAVLEAVDAARRAAAKPDAVRLGL